MEPVQTITVEPLQSITPNLASVDELIERWQDSAEPEAALRVTYALLRKVQILQGIGRFDEVADCLGRLEARTSRETMHDGDPVPLQVAYETLLLNLALKRPDLVRMTIDELRTQLQAASQDRGLYGVGSTLLMCGDALTRNGWHELALPAYETVQARLLHQPTMSLATLGVRAQISASRELTCLGRLDEGMKAIENVDDGGEAALAALAQLREEAPVREPDEFAMGWSAMYLLLIAEVLEQLGRHDESQAAATKLIEQYGDSTDPLVEMVVATARESWDFRPES